MTIGGNETILLLQPVVPKVILENLLLIQLLFLGKKKKKFIAKIWREMLDIKFDTVEME